MQAELTPMGGQKAIGITFTDKPVTAFGDLVLPPAVNSPLVAVENSSLNG